jgi:hypothetical protein
MPSFTNMAFASLAAIGTYAAPPFYQAPGDSCMSHNDAVLVAQKWAELITDYSDAKADAILTPNFVDYSQSVNTLINTCPQGEAAEAVTMDLLAATFNDRAQFKTGQGEQPPINFAQLQLWNSCDAVTIRWMTTNTVNQTDPNLEKGYVVKPVTGIIVMATQPAPEGSQYPHVINTVYSEFDAGAFLQNLVAAGICDAAAANKAAETTTTKTTTVETTTTQTKTAQKPEQPKAAGVKTEEPQMVAPKMQAPALHTEEPKIQELKTEEPKQSPSPVETADWTDSMDRTLDSMAASVI